MGVKFEFSFDENNKTERNVERTLVVRKITHLKAPKKKHM